jgi:hypothetical protein
MAGILNTVYSLGILVVALAGIVYVLGLVDGDGDDGSGGRSWWAWGVLMVVVVFLLAEVGMLLLG